MAPLITDKLEEIVTACKAHCVQELFVFGSAVRDDFHKDSDIDFIADFTLQRNTRDMRTIERYYDNKDGLQERLSQLLNRDVDLLTESSIRNKYLFHFINQEKQLLYAAA